MQNVLHSDRWLDLFPGLSAMTADHLKYAKEIVQFSELRNGDIAYLQGWECPHYLMCIDGQTRVYRRSTEGREVLVYRVTSGDTCILTTQCLLSGGTFPAESVAESDVRLAAIPSNGFRHLMDVSWVFREFVLNDYTRLLGSMFSLIEDVAFKSIDQRLTARLLADVGPDGVVNKTHQRLADDLGSVREVVTRKLGAWERSGWITTTRGSIIINDRAALARYREPLE